VLEPADGDQDGLSTMEELLLGTDPAKADTDGDTFPDGMEVFVTFTDPLVFNVAGGTIRGKLTTDPNGDGDVSDGVPVEDVVMYLDLDYDGARGMDEPNVKTLADGTYEFKLLPSGVYHVRQDISPGVIQTLPSLGVPPVLDGLPDEVVNYTHSALGALPVPYGLKADPWTGPPYIVHPVVPEEVDPAVVLEPLARRVVVAPIGVISTASLVSIPEDASILLRFDEMIIDGDGDDLLIITLDSPSGEEAEIFIGETEASLTSLGIFAEQSGPIGIDLANHGITSPIHYLKIESLNSGGSLPGFDLIGAEAVHFAPPRAGANVVTIDGPELVEDIDFARFFQDLPPRVFLSVDFPAPGGLKLGDSAEVQVTATDDIGLSNLTLTANGNVIPLDAEQRGSFVPGSAGLHTLQATAIDSAGQMDTRTWEARVLNADGSSPFDPSLLGFEPGSDPSAPTIRVTAPAAGDVVDLDTAIVATIGGLTEPNWNVDYALVDDIDPYELALADPDYISLSSGSGYETNGVVATFPGASVGNGIYFIRISASPSGGGPTRYFGQVIAKGVDGTTLRPAVTVTSPSAGGSVSMTVPVVGSISSDRPLREWYVDIAPADQVDPNAIGSNVPNWKRIAEGTDTISDDVITTLDATTLENGSYLMRIVAWNDIGLGRAEPLAIEITGDAKLGRHKRVFTDLEINLAGFDLSILRTYDSFAADDSGDFGFGWRMGIPDPEIGETVPTTGTGFFGATPFRDGTRVYLNTPDGRRVGFTFRPEFGAGSAIGAVYKATFEADTGVYETLEVSEGDTPFLSLNEQGEAFVFFLGLAWNPSQYILTTRDGKRYTYDEDAGLLEAADPNGNRLIVTETGVRHSSGVELSFVRDVDGRITEIIDPDNRAWLYGYDGNGDLVTMTDPDGRISTYTYFGDREHFLKSVADPLGRVGESYEYDADGRLSAVVDAQGNRIEQTWDPSGFIGSSTDRRGNTTEIVYDERGNIVSSEDPLGNVTLFEYGDADNPDRVTKETDALGNVTIFEFNAFGDPTKIKPPINRRETREYSYDDAGRVTNFYDFDGSSSEFIYDDQGNIIFQERFGGPKESFTYSSEGQPVTRTTRAGHLTTFGYDSETGFMTSVTTNDGYAFHLDLSQSGDLLGATGPEGDTYTFGVDARSIPLTQTDPAGNSKTVTEEADGTFVITNRGGGVE